MNTAEHRRLAETKAGTADWPHWGTYVSDRAWGTVREDYSADGSAWEYFPHDHARSRAYRWSEDGIAGFCDRGQHLCLSTALWNGCDPILKERMFGLSNREGNHGEDVKEYFFYLDNTPTHTYARMLYKYPQVAFPYDDLIAENARRTGQDPEYELFDALRDVFLRRGYFDVFIEYAKHHSEDILCRIRVVNRGPEAAPIHVLPHLWFRNTWSWTRGARRHVITIEHGSGRLDHPKLGERWWYVQSENGTVPAFLCTENDTNFERLFGVPNPCPYVKDGINDAVVHGRLDRVNSVRGSKVAAHLRAVIQPGDTFTVRVRLTPCVSSAPFADFDEVFAARMREADEFYEAIHAGHLTADERLVQRQAYAGLLWSKQFYHFDVFHWLMGDPEQPAPPAERWKGRNHDWALHLFNFDVVLMPDKWEYPWYASWDLAFHVVVMATIDPEFAKQQIRLLTHPRYQHPYGSVPAYEWDFGSVNPPVLAWATWQVYHLDRISRGGKGDIGFLASVFDALVMMLGWWVNRKDSEGKGIFGGGFLGLDNIGIFDRNQPLPDGGSLEQSDGTGWMAMFQLNMTAIAVELTRFDLRYDPFVHRFGQHFAIVAHVLQRTAAGGIGVWNEAHQFYFDVIRHESTRLPMEIYSMVGLVPLFAVGVVEEAAIAEVPVVMNTVWEALERRPPLRALVPSFIKPGRGGTRLLCAVSTERLAPILARVLDETQFLSDYGVRSVSRRHLDKPFQFSVGGHQYEVRYLPGESDNRAFGGNSNWRGPIWFPMNFLLIQSIASFARYFDDSYTIECPTGSGRRLTLSAVADDLAGRLTRVFLRDANGRRAVFGDNDHFQQDIYWRDYIPFHEYFHGDTGAGLGASHQTGWTALVALLLQHRGAVCFDRMWAEQAKVARTSDRAVAPGAAASA